MKQIMFSRTYPYYHPRKGENTLFVEKVWSNTDVKAMEVNKLMDEGFNYERIGGYLPKVHTIRNGKRWKEGEYFQPKVWSGKPYHTDTILFTQPLEIKKVYDIDIIYAGISNYHYQIQDCYIIKINGLRIPNSMHETLATNDGLNLIDFYDWFKKLPFSGQIICFGNDIEY